jgi:hypothetical protein
VRLPSGARLTKHAFERFHGVWLVDLASSRVKRQHRRGRIDIALQRSPLVLGGAAFAAIASQMPDSFDLKRS